MRAYIFRWNLEWNISSKRRVTTLTKWKINRDKLKMTNRISYHDEHWLQNGHTRVIAKVTRHQFRVENYAQLFFDLLNIIYSWVIYDSIPNFRHDKDFTLWDFGKWEILSLANFAFKSYRTRNRVSRDFLSQWLSRRNSIQFVGFWTQCGPRLISSG